MPNSIKILDCTLRDGGYYNNWDFPPEIVERYLDAVSKSKIDVVELGFRNFPKTGFFGAFAYTTEDFLNNIALPQGPVYGLMIDAKTILSSGLAVDEAVDCLFVPAEKSKIDLVRVAAHFGEVEDSFSIVLRLKELGYRVGFNLMQAGGKDTKVIQAKAKLVEGWDCIEVLYFADSLGNMNESEVSRIIDALQTEWTGPIGIHTHNNMGKALDNSLFAMNKGVSWLDVTVTGMGRGAGNAQTESLLAILNEGNSYYSPRSIYELVIQDFEPMQKQFGWGSSLLYFLAAQNDVHPTYIQNLLSEKRYGKNEFVGVINYLSKLEGTSAYNGDVFETAISSSNIKKEITGSNTLVNKFSNKEVLILANGPSLLTYKRDIESYISKNNPVVLAINTLSNFSHKYVDYYCVSHNSKLLSEISLYRKLEKPLILPLHLFSDDELLELEGERDLIDYGLKVVSEKFEVSSSFSIVPNETTVAYALSIASVANASSISLVGFDGFESNDLRQLEMIETLNCFKQFFIEPRLEALTPTTYPIEQSSIFAPRLEGVNRDEK